MTSQVEIKAIASLSDAVALSHLAPRAVRRKMLMCPPTYFEVKDAKNEFMSGNIGGVDRDKAREQWHALKATFEKCGFSVELIEPGAGLEDMVFTANQVLPALDADNHPAVILARMAYESRTREVPHFEKWFREHGYKVLNLPESCKRFEGGGDGVWHPERKLLWLGFGSRTEERCCDAVSNLLQVPVVKLRLVSAKFYHLDTCFAVLNANSVMIYPPAFDECGMSLIRNYFQNIVEVSEADANNFACNALALDEYVVLQKGSAAACADLQRLGFKPIEVDTSEFMKSGGSVFCMKQMVY